MRKNIYFILVAILLASSCGKKNVYTDATKPVDERIENLLSLMTLDEKLELLYGDSTGFATYGNKRLGIPALVLSDGPIGVRTKKATSLGAGVVMASTWDTLLMQKIGVMLGKETKAHGKNYLLGPCVNIHRMPLGGRNFESYSEDPYLASRMGVAWIKGCQSEKVITSVKHFALNNQEWNRNTVNSVVEERPLREIYLPAFEAAVKEAGVWSVMSAYNLVNGQHCSENVHLLKEILKTEWGFKGFVVSDWVSVYSTDIAANAGLDIEMPKDEFFTREKMKAAIKEGKITEETVNDKVRRLLRVRFEAGLFDEKMIADSSVLLSEEHKKIALETAQKGIVLLKNEKNFLPLDKSKIKSIAVIGPNGKEARTSGGGSSYTKPYYAISPFEGIQKKVGNAVKVEFSVGDNLEVPALDIVEPEFLLPPDGKTGKGLFCEIFDNIDLKGQPVLTRFDENINFNFGEGTIDPKVKADYFGVRWTGKIQIKETKEYRFDTKSDDGVRLWVNNVKLIENWSQHGATVDSKTIRLEANKSYEIKLEYFEKVGGGIIELGWSNKENVVDPNLVNQAVNLAKSSDVAILFVGAYAGIESEGVDRDGMLLPGNQDLLVESVAKANPNTIVCIHGGTPVNMEKWINKVKGIIYMSYAGQETGTAIADILFGDVNPSGKLTFTMITNEKQSPAMAEYKNENLQAIHSEGIFVGYRYYEKNNMKTNFVFGHGLSYTSFEYSDMQIKQISGNTFDVTLKIKNTGSRDGDEIVQIYVSDPECSVERPIKELKGFSRVSLKSGEQKEVKLRLNSRAFAFYDVNKKAFVVEPGEFVISAGSSSSDVKLKSSLQIK